jgi:uncharacterized protein (DUF302 family)
MVRYVLALVLAILPISGLQAAEGVISRASPYSMAETISRLDTVLQERKLVIFARVDHAAEAAKVGLTMPPTQLLIFGNPRAGTPLMLAAPDLAIDLPLKILIRQDAAGKVSVSYNSAAFLRQRHGLSEDQAKALAAVAGLVDAALK